MCYILISEQHAFVRVILILEHQVSPPMHDSTCLYTYVHTTYFIGADTQRVCV